MKKNLIDRVTELEDTIKLLQAKLDFLEKRLPREIEECPECGWIICNCP